MKTIKKIAVFGTALSFIISSCSVEKRVYLSGYHVDWKNGKPHKDKQELINSNASVEAPSVNESRMESPVINEPTETSFAENAEPAKKENMNTLSPNAESKKTCRRNQKVAQRYKKINKIIGKLPQDIRDEINTIIAHHSDLANIESAKRTTKIWALFWVGIGMISLGFLLLLLSLLGLGRTSTYNYYTGYYEYGTSSFLVYSILLIIGGIVLMILGLTLGGESGSGGGWK